MIDCNFVFISDRYGDTYIMNDFMNAPVTQLVSGKLKIILNGLMNFLELFFIIKGDNYNFFGRPIPNDLSNPTGLNVESDAILLSTEFKFDANLIEFNFYMLQYGYIKISVRHFPLYMIINM